MAGLRVSFILCVVISKSLAIINQLNDTEYARMPPVYHMEPYEECFFYPESIYCTVDFTLVSDTPSPLIDMIKEYSEITSKRFNHSKLTYGICVSTSCKNSTADLRLRIESCLNESMWDKYGLKTNVPEKFFCDRGEKIDVTTGDFIVAGVILLLLLLNVVGSCYDFYSNPEKDSGVRFLLCFSIRRNWRRLVSPPGGTPDSRFKRLKAFNGIKTVAIFLVIMAHSMIISAYFVDNTAFVEGEYNNFGYHLILNGTIIVQTFFIVSGFLLVYHLQVYAEKHRLDWKVIVKAIVLRWLRLTPVYALVLAFMLTWYRHLGSGPIWQKVVGTEISHCQQSWWYHLLYLNNYVDASECLAHTWYLAADTQLYILGVVVLVVFQSARSRKVVLSLLFIIGMAVPAAVTYFRDLDGTFIVSPESARSFYVHDPSYIELYSRGHTNIVCYVMGLALGLLVHHVQTMDIDTQKYKKYLVFIWATLPVGLVLVGSGKVFYLDGPRIALGWRVAAAALLKPTYGLLVAVALAACVFKLENLYRGTLEWWGWTTLSRITYSAFLLHYPFVKYFLGSQVTLLHISFVLASQIFHGTIFMVFLGAFPFWLLVEAPLAQLVKMGLPAERSKETEDTRSKDTSINYKL